MAKETPYAAVLQDLRAKRGKIDGLIKALEELSAGGVVPTEEIMAATGSDAFNTLLNSVRPGEFHGMKYPAAAHAILSRTNKHPLTTQQIVQIIEKTGRAVEGKNPVSTVYSTLSRSPHFEKVKRNTWGLTEWYPGAKRTRKGRGLSDKDAGERDK